MENSRNIVLLGPPGAGKGSIAVLLAKALALPHISTGAIFREEITAGTALGKKANSYMSEGQLVPDHLTNRLVANRLTKTDCDSGFILDGYPRSRTQAEVLDEMLRLWSRDLNAAILIQADEDIIIHRLSRRHVCTLCGHNYNLDPEEVDGSTRCKLCGGKLTRRDDDRVEAIKQRLAIYRELSQPLITYYEDKGILFTVINEDRSLGETGKLILKHLGAVVPDELADY